MEQAAILLVVTVGLTAAGFMVWTWAVVHQAATEAREYYRRQNAAGRVEDGEADALIDGWDTAP